MAKATGGVQQLSIPFGAAFEQRMAELIWESCPELARQTAAGKLALSVDFDSDEVQKRVTSDLLSNLVKKLLPDFEKRVKELLTNNGFFHEAIEGALEKFRSGVDVNGMVVSRLDRFIVKESGSRIKDLINEYIGGEFSRIVSRTVDTMIREEVLNRISHGRPAVEIERGVSALSKGE